MMKNNTRILIAMKKDLIPSCRSKNSLFDTTKNPIKNSNQQSRPAWKPRRK